MSCAHHWFIEEPKGPMSKGVCKLCGEQQEFANYLEEFERYSHVVIGKSYLQDMKRRHKDEAGGDLSEMQ